MATTVEVLAEAFKEAGTPFIVGHPGGESVELMEAGAPAPDALHPDEAGVGRRDAGGHLGRYHRQPRRVPVHARAGRRQHGQRRRPRLARSRPLIAITDAYSGPTYETGLRQRINQLAVYEPIVKWSTTIDAKTVRQQVRRAMRTATRRAAGPRAFRAAAERDARARPATTWPSRR